MQMACDILLQSNMLIRYGRSKFDPDVRSLIVVKFIHGFWRREDERRTDMMVRY